MTDYPIGTVLQHPTIHSAGIERVTNGWSPVRIENGKVVSGGAGLWGAPPSWAREGVVLGRPFHEAPTALRDVLAEREKQRAKWGDAHDDEHTDGVLGDAAATLAAQADSVGTYIEMNGDGHLWPGDLRHRHRGDRRQQLVIATALLLAEIERLDRIGK